MDPQALIERLRAAVGDHDLDALAECFAEGYRNETPVHPARGFEGRAQVRTNWARIFEAVPDVTATVLGTAVAGATVWSEWEMRGTRRDGAPHLMRGVILFGVEGDHLEWGRFFLEPVDAAPTDVGAAIGVLVEGPT